MSQRIVYQEPAGVRVVVPAPNNGLTMAQLAAKDVPAGVSWLIVDESAVPSDRTFRNAWAIDSLHIVVAMPQARTIWRDKLRVERAALLTQLDAEYMIALERNDAAELLRVAQRKQALRDAPADPRIDAAQTPEELKAIALP